MSCHLATYPPPSPSPCTAGGSDNTARAWAPDSPDCVVVYQGHGSSVNCIAASEANRELYTGSSDGTARSWDIETGQQLRVFDGHQSAIMCIKASVAPSVAKPVTHRNDVGIFLVFSEAPLFTSLSNFFTAPSVRNIFSTIGSVWPQESEPRRVDFVMCAGSVRLPHHWQC